MPVTITINGENAAQAIEEFTTLSASFIPGSTPTATAEVEGTKTRQRKASPSKKEEPTKPAKEDDEDKPEVFDFDNDEDGEKTEGAEPTHTLVELRALAKDISTADKAKVPLVKKVLTDFGYANVSSVEDKDVDAIYAKLEAL